MGVNVRKRFRAVVLRCLSAGPAAILWVALSAATLAAQEAEGEVEKGFVPVPHLLQDRVSVPKMIKVVKPKYPEALKKSEVEGVVILQTVINTDGKVEPASVKVVKNVHPDLDRACVEALIASEFSPATYEGHPVRVIMQIPYTFKFRSDTPRQLGGQDARGELAPTLLQSQASVMPKMTKVVKAVYPEALKRKEVEGTVVLQAAIDAEGRVEPATVKVVKNVHPDLDRAAVEALIASEFSPATYEGRPVRVIMQIPYAFSWRDMSDRVAVRAEGRGDLFFHLLDGPGAVVVLQGETGESFEGLYGFPALPRIAGVLLWRRMKNAEPSQWPAEAFSPADTLWADVVTVNALPGTMLLVRWIYLQGHSKIIITERIHRTQGEGTDVTQFFAAKATPWPAGTYELQVGLNGKIQGTARFQVGF